MSSQFTFKILPSRLWFAVRLGNDFVFSKTSCEHKEKLLTSYGLNIELISNDSTDKIEYFALQKHTIDICAKRELSFTWHANDCWPLT